MSEVVLKAIRKSYGSIETIHGVDLTIKDGEFVVLVGPSGCGKSTLLRLICGLEDISSGDLHIGGRRVNADAPSKRGIAMVFQSYALYPHMTVYQNMAFGLELAKASKGDIDTKVRAAAAQLELTPYLERLPKQLSGGQRQRVAIGRSIVREPKVFLFDEPLSNLDAGLRVQMRLEIAKLHRELKVTTVYVTHDQVEAMTLADKIVVLNKGNIEQSGSPLEIYRHPDNVFVATFLGSPKMNILDCELAGIANGQAQMKAAGSSISVPLAGRAMPQAKTGMKLGIRPEHIELVAQGGDVTAKVETVENLGESHLVYLQPGGGEGIVVRGDGEARVKRGDTVHAAFAKDEISLFGADGRALARR